ncbi:MAG TPA: YifB family Mg chelatase-like AAA ATPase [Pirellulales bacterium]|jgi:magnesium chelatase family protein|nr:YifB family Mg chelatase-like AAA ATPase [Pirellulales bacterium]
MATKQNSLSPAQLRELLKRDNTLNGGILFGLDGFVIEIQARAVAALGTPTSFRSATTISGMAHGAIRESLDRITGAFAKNSLPEASVEILVNLAPADLPKEGTWLDLPLAIILLQAAGILPDLPDHLEGDFILMGELGLHGEIRRVPGALSIASVAKPGQSLIVPAGNEKECALILAKVGYEGCNVYAVSTLAEVIEFFHGKRTLQNALKQPVKFENAIPKSIDFGKIRGQRKAKDAAVIAAAGGHNMLLIGPPGEGKSLLASAIPGILPRLQNGEKVDLTKIYSACGVLGQDGVAVTRRPFRSIHHTASKQSLVGGGSKVPRPGEITLAHLGVLFLDEIAEFSASTLEALRQPIEAGEICISRVGASITYPCRFTLVAAMNPCPCGYYGTDMCRCKPADIARYQSKISGPILDRIDLQVELERLTTDERFEEEAGDESPSLRTAVQAARELQATRFQGTAIPHNAAIPGGQVRPYCNFSADGFARYKAVVDENTMTTRTMDRLAKVARTIADLAASDELHPPHVDKAAGYLIGGLLRESF